MSTTATAGRDAGARVIGFGEPLPLMFKVLRIHFARGVRIPKTKAGLAGISWTGCDVYSKAIGDRLHAWIVLGGTVGES